VDEDKELLLQALIKINNLKRKSTFKLEDDIAKFPSKTTPSITTATPTRPTDTVLLHQVPQQRPTDVVPMYQMPQQQQQTTDAVPLYQIPQPNYMPSLVYNYMPYYNPYYPMYYQYQHFTYPTFSQQQPPLPSTPPTTTMGI